MFLEPFIPTTCWIAPDTPSEKYSFGDTTWPELPTCLYGGNHPISTTGLEDATSAPIASAKDCIVGRLSSLSIPLPIETISSAAVKSTPLEDSWNSGSLCDFIS